MTNTNWQYYGGETTMCHLSQMAGLAVQNFVSAGGRHGRAGRGDPRLHPARADAAGQLLGRPDPRRCCSSSCRCRSSGALLLARGWCRTSPSSRRSPPSGGSAQTLPGGPVASQIAIKQLGTNGGGSFNANSALPYENPTPFTNFLEMLALLLIPSASTATYGRMVGRAARAGRCSPPWP